MLLMGKSTRNSHFQYQTFEEPALTTGFYDDRWYTKPAQTYFYQNDMKLVAANFDAQEMEVS